MFDSANISIFAGSGGQVFAERMCRYMGRKVGNSEVITFSEGNTFVRINESVRDRDVYLVQPIGMHSNNEFVEILFWMDAFKRANALTVTLVMPYFAYAKGDKKDEPRVSIRARVCAECMELAGADRFVTMDLHAQQVQGFFKRPMDHLYAMPMLSEIIRMMNLPNAVVVSPDAGYAKQARKYASALSLPIAIGDKERFDHSENAQVLEIIGCVEGKDALIVDDFTISGGTLVNIADALKKRGAQRIFALLSHNIISARGVTRIDLSPIETVFSTDTVDNPNIIGHPKFKTISVAPMFAETIMRFYNYESINSMFSQLPENIVHAGFELADLTL
ncbi:MAG: ribose-phosphate diphosphokinase [Clostridiales bacterium]|nr:ribose-phosphate diphosphokinase [Clostridiales bacterium]OPZ66959.1 MAG: Ribose-phosphate pyrophosphokinase [Firmicutes bacterium ADurb.Bin467]